MHRPNYEALDGQGSPYNRPAKVVGELPTSEVDAALTAATHEVAKLLNITAQRRIPYGAPVYVSFGLTRPQAKNHAQCKLLLTVGHELSLNYCPQYK